MIALAAACFLATTAVAGTSGDAGIEGRAGEARTGEPAEAPAAPAPVDPVEAHRFAAKRLTIIVEEAFAEIRRALVADESLTEAEVVAFIEQRFARDGLVAGRPPRVAAGRRSSYPDHAGGTDAPIHEGDIVVIELMARRDAPGAVHARTSWTAFAGTRKELPPRVHRVWKIVKEAREAALTLVHERFEAHASVTGAEVDAAARSVVRRAKHGPWFLHAAGVALGPSAGGAPARNPADSSAPTASAGPALAAGETRALEPGQCFALHPAVYYPGEFGVRSEVSFCLTAVDTPEVTTGVRQVEIRPLLE